MERIGLAPGSEVGGYRIVSPLGSGGMGAVYRAADGGGTEVALKLLHPHVGADAAARERLRREVLALQRLRHPGVAAVLDAEADSTEAFIVTELVDGENLARHVREHGPLDAPALADLAQGLFEVLEAVHAAGVVHRDLKPANVVLTPERPVLIDFGIAQGMDEAPLTSTGIVLGTPGYLAPELLDGAEPDDGSDWWGWAAVLAFAATGREPFGARPMEAVLARARSGELDVAGLGPRMAAVLRGALDPRPGERTPPSEVVTELGRIADEGDGPATVGGAVGAGATVPLVGALPPTQVIAEEPTEALANDGRTRAWPGVASPTDDGVRRASGGGDDDARFDDADGFRHDDEDGFQADDEDGFQPDDEDDGGPRGGGDGAASYGTNSYGTDSYGTDAYGTDAYGSGAYGENRERTWDERAVGQPEGPEPYAAPVPRRRPGTLVLLGALAVAAAALAPGVTAIAVGVVTIVFGAVQSAGAALEARRERRGGPRRGDVVRATLAWPWHLVRGAAVALPSLLVAASVAVVVGGVAWWALDTGRLVVPPVQGGGGTAPGGGNEPWVYLCVLAVAMLGGLAALWFGPLSRPTRIGARRTLERVAPGRTGASVVVTLALVGIAVVVVLLVTGSPTWWWPLPGPPSLA